MIAVIISIIIIQGHSPGTKNCIREATLKIVDDWMTWNHMYVFALERWCHMGHTAIHG